MTLKEIYFFIAVEFVGTYRPRIFLYAWWAERTKFANLSLLCLFCDSFELYLLLDIFVVVVEILKIET